ncbi:hypothetical protein BN1232_02258 [Mycobacterium lentiflavum]|uniref:Uncharacterized protein n=1 Tax=Mycobacterium lentiflavum TaxID=141349 RepID=A0A0E4GX61_MYCLN|nr:hypothetical protein BN1232_02258 [Mycobacterium lentiflavum]
MSDDLLIDLGRGPTVVKAELTLVCGMSRQTRRGEKVFSDKDISFFSRRIIPPQFSMIDKA